MGKKILIVGFGSAGSYVLDFLARTKGLENDELIIGTRSIDSAIARINICRVSAGIMGFYPNIKYRKLDLMDTRHAVDILREIQPDIIVYTGRFIKGIKYGELSYPNNIGYGVWTPLALPLVYRLMKAVRDAKINTKVINSSYSDAVCPALASVGLAPFTGAGNLNHLIPRIKIGIALKKNVRPDEIEVMMLGSHFLNTYVSKESSAKGSPYFMECKINGKKIDNLTDEDIFKLAKIAIPGGPVRNLMIASDIVKIVQSIIFDEGFYMHLPGPNGLIGAYPSKIYKDKIEILLPEGMSLENAIKINADSLRYDGIDSIADGKIYFTDTSISKMKEVFGLTYPKVISVEECELFADKIKPTLVKYMENK
ncbi:MAG: hypothetical protein LHV68_02200 [Elusimicrobia bacterium]|nr:hypothetical protein [Candidatus Liberimonas magnetica]